MKYALVDSLGLVKAQLAELKIKEAKLTEQIKSALIKAHEVTVEGVAFRATLSVTERVTLDTKAASQLLPRETHPDLYKSGYTESLRVTAKTGELLEAEREAA